VAQVANDEAEDAPEDVRREASCRRFSPESGMLRHAEGLHLLVHLLALGLDAEGKRPRRRRLVGRKLVRGGEAGQKHVNTEKSLWRAG